MERLCSGKTSRSGCYLIRKAEGRILDLVDPSRPSSLLGCVQDPSLAMQTWHSPVATSARPLEDRPGRHRTYRGDRKLGQHVFPASITRCAIFCRKAML